MATVTIGKSYFDALLRRAEFHASGHQIDDPPSLCKTVTISEEEHEYMLQAVREYNLLRNALFRGGLTTETLRTLLEGEQTIPFPPSIYDYRAERPIRANQTGVSLRSDNTAVGSGLLSGQSHSFKRVVSYGNASSFDTPPEDDDDHYQDGMPRIPVHDQRTIFISNISERTTHKDLVNVIRGGRLLDIFLRNDRSASVSFVEGASEFLAHAKRNDIYVDMKRLEFRWGDRQFTVPSHVSNKIAGGATRNLIVHSVEGKLTADQIRDHLDHIHNLVVVDITFKNGDAYISTNSIHNALFARTCMMSRTAYKGLRIDYFPDECAAPLPMRSAIVKAKAAALPVLRKPMLANNQFALLDTGSDSSGSEDDSCLTDGIKISRAHWADAAVA